MAGQNDKTINGSDYRAFPRHSIHAIVRVRIDEQNDVYSATLNDYSKGGLCLVTGFPLPRDALINIESPISEISSAASSYAAPAKVLWSRQFSENPRHVRYGSGSRWMLLDCNWCGEPLSAIHSACTEDGIRLCPRCYEELQKNDDRRLGQCVRRFLLGNVL
ncbi:MAG: PilZ domain-containing protein [Thermodesulfobacteriota bacterium]